jgi:hypothetical protein
MILTELQNNLQDGRKNENQEQWSSMLLTVQNWFRAGITAHFLGSVTKTRDSLKDSSTDQKGALFLTEKSSAA